MLFIVDFRPLIFRFNVVVLKFVRFQFGHGFTDSFAVEKLLFAVDVFKNPFLLILDVDAEMKFFLRPFHPKEYVDGRS